MQHFIVAMESSLAISSASMEVQSNVSETAYVSIIRVDEMREAYCVSIHDWLLEACVLVCE
jgi:hypothetical protein